MIKLFLMLTIVCTSAATKYRNDWNIKHLVSLEGYSPTNTFAARLCTGSLIAQKWILTAAHCIDRGISRARFGELSMSPKQPATYISRILKKIPHPGYRKIYENFKHVYSVNDISLLLIEDVILKNYVTISPVYYNSIIGLPTRCVAFGATVVAKELVKDRNHSWEIDGNVVDCKSPAIAGTSVCTMPKCGLRFSNSTVGDLGGPMIYDGQVIGIAGLNLMTKLPIERFLPASLYLGWINELTHLNANKSSEI